MKIKTTDYRNINERLDYKNITYLNDLSKIKDLKLSLSDYDIFLEYRYENYWSTYRLMDLENGNQNASNPNKTNEFSEETTYTVWLRKINSPEFLQNFIKKVLEIQSEKDDDLYFYEFLEVTGYDYIGAGELDQFYRFLGGKRSDLEVLYNEQNLDGAGNYIDLIDYEQLDCEELLIGYLKKK